MKRLWQVFLVGALALALVAMACAPAAAPTATPTKAPAPPAVAPTAAPKEAAKPAAPAPTAAPAKATGAPIKIGYITPLTGAAAQNGQLDKLSVFLAVEDINNAGGINGYPIQVIMDDSALDPKQAVTMVRKQATQDKVFAIVGPYATGEMDVAGPLAMELQIPVFGHKTTKPGFSAQYRPWVYRVTLTDDVTHRALIAYFKKQYPNVKKVVIAGDVKEAVTENMVKNVWPQLLKEAGYEIQDTVPYEYGVTDFSAIVTKIKGMNPEAIAYGAASRALPAEFAKELERQGVKAPVMGSYHLVPSFIILAAGKSMDGWLSVTSFHPDTPDPKGQEYNKRWQAKADADAAVVKPATLSMEAQTYDLMMMLAQAMRKANITPDMDLAKARRAIADNFATVTQYRGVVGNITLQPSGDTVWEPTLIVGKAGKWELVK